MCVTIFHDDIINNQIDITDDDRGFIGSLLGTDQYVLKIETNKNMYYWSFYKKINAEIAQKKVTTCHCIEFSNEHDHDFKNVRIYFNENDYKMTKKCENYCFYIVLILIFVWLICYNISMNF